MVEVPVYMRNSFFNFFTGLTYGFSFCNKNDSPLMIYVDSPIIIQSTTIIKLNSFFPNFIFIEGDIKNLV